LERRLTDKRGLMAGFGPPSVFDNIAREGALPEAASGRNTRKGATGRGDTRKKPMFAVLKTGGKQYRVKAGDTLRVEKLAADAGDTVQFNDILMVGATVGTPLVAGAAVQATVVDQVKGDKVIHFVKRRRKHGSQRTKGHRQSLTLVRITEILEKGGDKSGVKAAVGAGTPVAAAEATPAKKAPAKKPAAKKAAAETE
jgi:large subunit ribosomal protein L21